MFYANSTDACYAPHIFDGTMTLFTICAKKLDPFMKLLLLFIVHVG